MLWVVRLQVCTLITSRRKTHTFDLHPNSSGRWNGAAGAKEAKQGLAPVYLAIMRLEDSGNMRDLGASLCLWFTTAAGSFTESAGVCLQRPQWNSLYQFVWTPGSCTQLSSAHHSGPRASDAFIHIYCLLKTCLRTFRGLNPSAVISHISSACWVILFILSTSAVASPPDQSRRGLCSWRITQFCFVFLNNDNKLAFILQPLFISSFVSFVAVFTTPRGPELFTVGEHVVVFAHVPGLHRSFTPPLLVCRCWALALFGGNSETGFDQNTTYSIFSISITLTDEGFQSFYQVKRSLHLFSPLFCLSGGRGKKTKIPTRVCGV